MWFRLGPVLRCEQVYEHSMAVKGQEFLDWLSDCRFFKKDFCSKELEEKGSAAKFLKDSDGPLFAYVSSRSCSSSL